MLTNPIFLQAALWALTLLVLASAVLVVTLHNLFRAALSLGLVLLGVAGLFVLLEAEFVAFAQVLVYVGAILTLVVFAVMLTTRFRSPDTSATRRAQAPAALISLAFFAVLARATQILEASLPATASTAVPLSELGRELITTLVLPFEVISLLFVAAIVGAIAVAVSSAKPRAESEPS